MNRTPDNDCRVESVLGGRLLIIVITSLHDFGQVIPVHFSIVLIWHIFLTPSSVSNHSKSVFSQMFVFFGRGAVLLPRL
jgi:hypothetical protein